MAWNAFLWPFLVTNSEEMMTVTVGITQVDDAFGVKYARDMAVAILAALPVALAYLLFQKRVTQALMLSSGIKDEPPRHPCPVHGHLSQAVGRARP